MDSNRRKVTYNVRSVVTRLANNREYLLVTLTINCPVCGEIEMQLPGHHLGRIVSLLRQQEAEHLSLTNPGRADAEVRELIMLTTEAKAADTKETKH